MELYVYNLTNYTLGRKVLDIKMMYTKIAIKILYIIAIDIACLYNNHRNENTQ